jgi:hypothetical protein
MALNPHCIIFISQIPRVGEGREGAPCSRIYRDSDWPSFQKVREAMNFDQAVFVVRRVMANSWPDIAKFAKSQPEMLQKPVFPLSFFF